MTIMIRKRMPRNVSTAFHLVGASSCPACTSNHPPLQTGFGHTVIYRRSHRSITYRCNKCGALWTMTLANLHKVASAMRSVHPYYAWVAEWTKDAAKNEKAWQTCSQRPTPTQLNSLGWRDSPTLRQFCRRVTTYVDSSFITG